MWAVTRKLVGLFEGQQKKKKRLEYFNIKRCPNSEASTSKRERNVLSGLWQLVNCQMGDFSASSGFAHTMWLAHRNKYNHHQPTLESPQHCAVPLPKRQEATKTFEFRLWRRRRRMQKRLLALWMSFRCCDFLFLFLNESNVTLNLGSSVSHCWVSY